jgi:hypothetical protein
VPLLNYIITLKNEKGYIRKTLPFQQIARGASNID